MNQPLTLIENQWRDVLPMLPLDSSEQQRFQWHREVRSKSARIKNDLKMRFAPLDAEDDGTSFKIRASGVAGMLNLFGTSFQVIPKFMRNIATVDWQNSILSMLYRVRSHYAYVPSKKLTHARTNFVDHVALAYRDALEHALRGEPIQTYQTRVEVSSYVRGRLAIERSITTLLTHPHQLHYEVDYMETDNSYNHLLQWATNRFIVLVQDGSLQRQLSAISKRLPQLSSARRVPARITGTAPTQYQHYAEAIRIASMLAKGYGYGQDAGMYAGYGLLLNMERLFEGFVEKTIQHVTPSLAGNYTAKPQVSKPYAQSFDFDEKPYYTRPDNVLYLNDTAIMLLDAKYKTLAEADNQSTDRPQNSDIYQMYASLMAHGCQSGVLIYPRLVSTSAVQQPKASQTRYWKVSYEGRALFLGAATIDISDLSTIEQVKKLDEEVITILKDVLALKAG